MAPQQERLARALGERYAVKRELGSGGMSTVYLAEDVRLGRPVAIKVLDPDVARALGSDRFLREIEIAARLNHPRIVPLLESGAMDELVYFVMPHVDGESLRERLERERQLPVEDAVEIARQVAAALAYAHRHGIVHRDIKPENILLANGEAVVADFGIARAVTVAGGSRLTETGVAVGTVPYMSPEQASGDSEVDSRSDIYSLGCVLYEMLAGEIPFTGATAQAITARKLATPAPDVTLVRENVPPSVGDALRKALARVPADRYSTAGQLAEALAPTVHPAPFRSAASAEPRTSPSRTRSLAAAGITTSLLVLAAWGWLRPSRGAMPEPVRFAVALPSGLVGGGVGNTIALSPDGRTLVAMGGGDEGSQLYRRALDGLDLEPIPGTAGAQTPFFSPDGSWLGFYADGRLRRVPLVGGAVLDIIRLPRVPTGGVSWGPDDRIVFAPDFLSPLHIVDARGGRAETLTTLDEAAGEASHGAPEVLPGGRGVLFAAAGQGGSASRIFALDLASEERAFLTNGSLPKYAASGHLVLRRGGTLLAAPFDSERLELTGPVVPIPDSDDNITSYSLSRTGTLAFVRGSQDYTLSLVGNDGRERSLTEERLTYSNPQFSPDGLSLAVTARGATGDDVWIYDLRTGARSRLTVGGGRSPVWTPDGAAVTFAQQGRGVFTRRVDGSAEPQQELELGAFHWIVGWTPDASTLAVGVTEEGIVAVSEGGSRTVVPGAIWGGRLSADGRWLAYYSFETGRFDVWVTRFPEGGARWQITTDGGGDPSWAPGGLELYYRSGERLVAAQVDTTAGVRVLSRRVVLERFEPPQYDDYDVHPDLSTLAVVQPVPYEERRDVVVVVNWFTGLQRSVRP
jgi:serine/threonine-protein kinase